MIRKILAGFFLLSALAFAQNTVTGTIQDANGNPYANGTASAVTVPSSGQPSKSTTPVATNSAGFFTLSLASNTYIVTLCAPPTNTGPLANPTPKQVCFSSGPIAISGNVDISSTLNPLAALLGPGNPPTPSATVSTLPSASLNTSRLYRVTDGQNSGDCTSGGGSSTALCISNGVSWVATGGSSTAFGSITAGTNANPLVVGTGGSLSTSGSGTIAATSVPFSGNTPGSNTGALTMGTGGSLTPLNNGQIASTQSFFPPGLVAPSMTASNTGGNIPPGHLINAAYTLTSVLGEGFPSSGTGNIAVSSLSSGACVSSNCSVTITSPTVPTGYTWTAYWCDINGGGCTAPMRVNACQGLANGVGCTITAQGLNSGVNLPTLNASIVQPPNPQAGNSFGGCTPFAWGGKDDGNNYPQLCMDITNTNNFPPSPNGTLSFLDRVWFNNTKKGAPAGKNALVAISDDPSNTATVSNTGQDRAFHIEMDNPAADSTAYYAWEGIQCQLDFNGTATITGSPDAEVSCGSFQTTINNTGPYGSNAYGTNAIRAQTYRQAGATVDSVSNQAITSIYTNQSTVSAGNATASSVKAECTNTVTATNLGCVLFFGDFPSTANLFSNTPGLGQIWGYHSNVPSWSARAGVDWFLRNDIAEQSWMNGTVFMSGLSFSSVGTLPVNGPTSITSSVQVVQASAPPTPSSVTGSGGASQYGYTYVCVDGNGGQISGGQALSSAVLTNPLTSGNPATINGPIVNAANGALFGQCKQIDLWRSAGPMALGKIVSGITCNPNNAIATCSAVTDTGLGVLVSGSPPSGNTTGSLAAINVLMGGGTACTNGELALSAGWQSTGSATVTAVAGTGQTCSWTITTGTTTAATPTVTDTLTNPLPNANVVCEMNIHGGTHTAAAGEYFSQTTLSATAPVFTFSLTPTAGGTTYLVTRRCGP